jgi:hypothetical protein
MILDIETVYNESVDENIIKKYNIKELDDSEESYRKYTVELISMDQLNSLATDLGEKLIFYPKTIANKDIEKTTHDGLIVIYDSFIE